MCFRENRLDHRRKDEERDENMKISMDNHRKKYQYSIEKENDETDHSIYAERRVLIYMTIVVQGTSCRERKRKRTRRDNDDEERRCRNMIKPVALLSFSLSPSLFLCSTQMYEREGERRKMSTAVPSIWLYERICTLLTGDYRPWMTTGDRYSLFSVKTRRRKSVASQYEIKSVWKRKPSILVWLISFFERGKCQWSVRWQTFITYPRECQVLVIIETIEMLITFSSAGNKHYPITDKLWSDQ